MPLQIDGQTYYRTKEALEKIGISRPTWFRWLKDELVDDVRHTDRRGWRLFTSDDIERIRKFANTVRVAPKQENLDFDNSN